MLFRSPKPSLRKTVPPKIENPEKLLGFTEENWHESFFFSTISLLALYGCNLPESTQELRQLAVKKLKARKLQSGNLSNKLKDFTFNLNYEKYKQFLDDFSLGKVSLDPNLYLAEALSYALYRPITFISSLARHKNRQIIHFNHDSDKPPLVFGIYEREGKEIFLPFFYNKNAEFNLDQLKDKIQIVAYMAKTIPATFKSRPILDLEVFAILTALHSFQRYISGVKVKLLTDSRVLYYLFNSKIGNSCVKIRRWCLKLIGDYPLISLHFVRTTDNLADFLTREGLPQGDCEKLNLNSIQISDFYDKLPKHDFSLIDWINYVGSHPEYLTINQSYHPNKKERETDLKAVALSISRGIENIKEIMSPIEILKERLSRANIIQAQKKEFSQIYENCLASQDFIYDFESPDQKPIKYRLFSDLLFIILDEPKILIPPSMIGLLLSYTHLLGHKGLKRMLADLNPYYFPKLYTITKNFIECCYSCFLTNKGNRKSKIGIYPTPSYPFEEVIMDLAENLNTVSEIGRAHV